MDDDKVVGCRVSGERAHEGGFVGWPSVCWEDELHRELEQGTQRGNDLVLCYAVPKPFVGDL